MICDPDGGGNRLDSQQRRTRVRDHGSLLSQHDCTHAPRAVRDAEVRGRGCDRPLMRISLVAMSLRIVVAEDSLLVREGIVRLLSTAPDIDVVASCGDYNQVIAAVEDQDPDVVVTDIKMPPTSTDEGIRLAGQLRGRHPNVGVVVLSQYSNLGYVLALFEAGSDRRGYLLKERLGDRSVLVSAIRSVAAGGSSVDPKVVDVLVLARSECGELSTR